MDGYPLTTRAPEVPITNLLFFHRVYCEEDWDLTANGRLYYRWGVDLFDYFTNMQKISIMAFIIF